MSHLTIGINNNETSFSIDQSVLLQKTRDCAPHHCDRMGFYKFDDKLKHEDIAFFEQFSTEKAKLWAHRRFT